MSAPVHVLDALERQAFDRYTAELERAARPSGHQYDLEDDSRRLANFWKGVWQACAVELCEVKCLGR